MSSPTSRLLAIATMITLSACGQSSGPGATALAPAPAAKPVASDSLGVPECDDYLSRYQACVSSKAPEAARAALVQSLDRTRAAWRNVIARPGGKANMATACKQVHDTARSTMVAYGCTDF